MICADTFDTSELFRPHACPETDPRHYYCADCMKMAFEGALRDEARFPVRCCPASGPFDIAEVEAHFDNGFISEYRHREAEMKARNRVYCHRPTCSTFITPQDIEGDRATCRACREQTCVRCKKEYHPGSECPPEDQDTQDTIQLGREERWQRCPACQDMVDLHSGCNHMSE